MTLRVDHDVEAGQDDASRLVTQAVDRILEAEAEAEADQDQDQNQDHRLPLGMTLVELEVS